MFGIFCAPEIFPKVMERMLSVCEEADNFIEDILVDEEELNSRLKHTLRVLTENNVVLNASLRFLEYNSWNMNYQRKSQTFEKLHKNYLLF